MVPTPIDRFPVYLQPVGAVMRLFGHHQGLHALDVSYSGNIDAVASRTDDRIFIHIANVDMHAEQTIRLELDATAITDMQTFMITADPRTEITPVNTDCFAERHSPVIGNTIILPPASVAAIEFTLPSQITD